MSGDVVEVEEYVDYQTVRDALLDSQRRRGFLTYEQKLALQHAEWAASESRMGARTEQNTFGDLYNHFMGIDKIAKYPDVAAKLAEILPLSSDDVRAVLASRRIAVEANEIELVLDLVRQHVL